MFMMYILIALMAIFKSYPSYADIALYLAMLPMWSHALGCKYLHNHCPGKYNTNPLFINTDYINYTFPIWDI